MTDKIDCDIEAALAAIRNGTGLTGKGGALTPLIKQLTEAAMKAELDEHTLLRIAVLIVRMAMARKP